MAMVSGSFRDPAGCVFQKNGRVFRSVFSPGTGDYEAARDAGIYDALKRQGLLLPHSEVAPMEGSPEGSVYCLEHPRIPMVSYPWEWPFSLLKDAALLHLQAMDTLVPKGFWLRDASAFNVQHDGSGLRLIDTLSIGRRFPDSPWVGYGQFCAHFLAPLALAAFRDVRLLGLWRNHIDGFPLDLAVRLLPLGKKCRPGILMHLTLHGYMQRAADRKDQLVTGSTRKTPKVSDQGILNLVRSLQKCVERIRWKRSSQIWAEYGDLRTYSEEDVSRKKEFVDGTVAALGPAVVWDLGANTGEFSFIAAARGAFVVSIDGDPACSELMYLRAREEKGAGAVLPLTMDLANPSPGLGWDHRERMSLAQRGGADLVLALALIHHLVFSSCIPMPHIAAWLSELGEKIIVEFVPPEDPMVLKLKANRVDGHLPYDRHVFMEAFQQHFKWLSQTALPNGRHLFLGERISRSRT